MKGKLPEKLTNDRSLDIGDVIRDLVERCREDSDERPVIDGPSAIPPPSVARQEGGRAGFGAVFDLDSESKRWVLHSKSSTRLACSASTLLMGVVETWEQLMLIVAQGGCPYVTFLTPFVDRILLSPPSGESILRGSAASI